MIVSYMIEKTWCSMENNISHSKKSKYFKNQTKTIEWKEKKHCEYMPCHESLITIHSAIEGRVTPFSRRRGRRGLILGQKFWWGRRRDIWTFLRASMTNIGRAWVLVGIFCSSTPLIMSIGMRLIVVWNKASVVVFLTKVWRSPSCWLGSITARNCVK